MTIPSPPLLLVTDRSQARAPLEEILAAAFEAGCRWASLREKDLPPDEQVALARRLHAMARRHDARLTLHGSADLAQAAEVDGVHLPGGSDVAAARGLLGPAALVGLSVHSSVEAVRLPAEAADYVVAGPAFESASKPGYGPALGAGGIAAVAASTRCPVVAIGGIDERNAAALLKAGAAGVAVMGGVMRAADPAAEVGSLLDAIGAGR